MGILKKVLVVILVLLLAFAGWFFFIFAKTPLYSLGMVGYAYWAKDYPRFERHVDIGAIVNNGYDDLSAVYLKGTTDVVKKGVSNLLDKISSKGIFGKLASKEAEKAVAKIDPALKQKITNEVTKLAKSYFAKPEEAKQAGTESKGNKLSLKDIMEVENDGKNALMSIVLQNGKKEELPIQCLMSRIDNDEWKVVGIANIANIVANRQKFSE
ncbi:MAG: hypothetical protein MJ032_02515 [Acidaminococcaceae bacterium]|nr:hypothetical protein [Acidaminococcaceae bacterium]